MQLNRQQRRAGAKQASRKGKFLLLTPHVLVDHVLPDGVVVKKVCPDTSRQYIVPSLADLLPFSVSRFMSQAQAQEVEKMLSYQLKRDVIVVTDNIALLHVEELTSAQVAAFLEKGKPVVNTEVPSGT